MKTLASLPPGVQNITSDDSGPQESIDGGAKWEEHFGTDEAGERFYITRHERAKPGGKRRTKHFEITKAEAMRWTVSHLLPWPLEADFRKLLPK